MASTYADFSEEEQKIFHLPSHHNHHHNHTQSSPKSFRRTFSDNSSACSQSTAGAAPKCVCAPPTHARSFKCRLHRSNSHGHSASAPPPPPPPAASSSTRTVEAL